VKITVDTKGIDATIAKLRGLSEKKIQVATVSALNDAAYAGSQAAKKEIDRVFDRPTPWVKGGVRYEKALRAPKLVGGQYIYQGRVMASYIDLDYWGNKQLVSVEDVLRAQISGGARRHKRHEVALQRAGILPNGMGIVPGSAAKIDQFGNMSSGQIVQIIAWFRGFGEQGYKANIDDKGRRRLGKDSKRTGARGFAYFALQKPYGKLLPGVYQRIQTSFGSAVKPVMIFVRMPKYAKRYDFYGVSKRAAEAQFKASFPRYLRQLLDERGL
jgi:hypothetical protein